MQATGSGLTFTDHDLKMARVIVGLLSRSQFKDLDAAGVVEGASAFKWLESLIPNIKDNILDFAAAKMVEPAPAPQIEPVKKGRKK